MGFWSGFEGLTGHRPGAFKGFSLKDILDKDMWERRERLGGRQSRQFEETGVVPTTNWYRGRGRPEMMGPRVGAAGVTPVNPASRVPFTRRQGGFTGPRSTREYPIVPSDRISHDYARTSPARPWANLQPENLLTPSWAGSAASADRDVGMGAGRFLQLGDPRNIRSGPDLPPASQADRTTTIKKFADPNKSDEETTVIKDKVQGGPAYNRPPPNWLERVSHGEGPINPGYFSRPTTFSSPMQPEGALTSSAQPTSIMNMFNMKALKDLARRKWEERMRARGGY